MSSERDRQHLEQAIELACQSVANNGGPFGAVIVKDDQVIGRGHNQVTLNNDPSAHAEIIAIRDACKTLNNFELNDCTIYASCEPCPMCMSAIYWARIERVVYASSSEDAAQAGFDDSVIAEEICKPYSERSITIEQCDCHQQTLSFEHWQKKSDKIKY